MNTLKAEKVNILDEPKRAEDLMIGTLNKLIFKSDKNDSTFIIGSFIGSTRKEFIALGDMFQPEIGVEYRLRGQWVSNDRFGKQFKFHWHTIERPTNSRGMYAYLVRMCKWIGPAIANQICDAYGDKALDILKSSPDRVAAQIKGITPDRAKEIQDILIANDSFETVMVDLEGMFASIKGLPRSLTSSALKTWGSDAVEIIKKNPYRLTKIKGVGFHMADEVALNIGFNRDSYRRERAAVWHVITETMQSTGSVWVSMDEIEAGVMKLIGKKGIDGIFRLQKLGMIVERDAFYTIASTDADETYIAKKIGELLTTPWEKSTGPSGSENTTQPMELTFTSLSI